MYDADKIIEKIGLLRSSFDGVNLKIKYAAKALTNVSILKLMRQQGVEMDSVSVNEARMGMLAGFEPRQIMFTPSGVSFDEIREAVESGFATKCRQSAPAGVGWANLREPGAR